MQRANGITQTVNNFFQCGKNLVTEPTFSDLFSNLFNGIHLGRIRGDVEKDNVLR